MQREIFSAGVAPGAPVTLSEVKVLVCHMIDEADAAMSFELIHEALREHGLVNYFDLISALSQLCQTGHLRLSADDGVEMYHITDLGCETSRELTSALPKAVREKAVPSARRAIGRQRRLSEVRTDIREEAGGFILTMRLPDGDTSLASFEVFAPNKQECERLRLRFLNDPVFIYQSVMALLSGKRDILGEPLPPGDDLFR